MCVMLRVGDMAARRAHAHARSLSLISRWWRAEECEAQPSALNHPRATASRVEPLGVYAVDAVYNNPRRVVREKIHHASTSRMRYEREHRCRPRAQMSVPQGIRRRLGLTSGSRRGSCRGLWRRDLGSGALRSPAKASLSKGTCGRTLPILAFAPTAACDSSSWACVTRRRGGRITRPEAVAAIRTISLPDCGTLGNSCLSCPSLVTGRYIQSCICICGRVCLLGVPEACEQACHVDILCIVAYQYLEHVA